MLTLQELWDIAHRHATKMATAMVAACLAKADELGVTLAKPPVTVMRTQERGKRPTEHVEWERIVRANTDTARNHC